ncbi:putative type VI secretion system effector [Rahnella aquatilis]|uniref:putative type VI secretion system effector n=1 Tax=Rahnella aquatilis TaxID=34038 RepID=UPI0006490992
MTTNRKFSGEFVDFEEVRRKKSHCETIIEVNNKWMVEHSDEYDPIKTMRENNNASAEINKLDNILANEPPPPELPPRHPLSKVCGVLEEFTVQKVMGYFTAREYEPDEFARLEEQNQIGGLLLAMTGNAAASSVTSQSRERKNDACDFVRGKINGIPFHGWLGQTHVREGDYVEMAVAEQDGHYVVYAIILPELRTISITPRCHCGREADIKFARGCGLPAIASIFLVMLIVFYFKGMGWQGIAVCAAMFGGALFLAYWRAARSTRKKPGPVIDLAEHIFATLGFTKPQRVDLRKLTKERLKILPSEETPINDREMPSRTSSWVDYFYYY